MGAEQQPSALFGSRLIDSFGRGLKNIFYREESSIPNLGTYVSKLETCIPNLETYIPKLGI